LWLVVVFVVLSVSVPSYGYFLIYNVSGSAKGANDGSKASISWKAYLLMDINDGNGILQDANMVMYGKDSTKTKVYIQFNVNGTAPLLRTYLPDQGSDFMAFNFYDYNDPFDFEGLIIGKVKSKKIGLDVNKNVASSMKGMLMIWDGQLFDADDYITATGNVSATLNNSFTKAVNDTDPVWTKDEIVATGKVVNGKLRGMIPDLEAKDYTNATPVIP
jgi:hypothetical protein